MRLLGNTQKAWRGSAVQETLSLRCLLVKTYQSLKFGFTLMSWSHHPGVATAMIMKKQLMPHAICANTERQPCLSSWSFLDDDPLQYTNGEDERVGPNVVRAKVPTLRRVSDWVVLFNGGIESRTWEHKNATSF